MLSQQQRASLEASVSRRSVIRAQGYIPGAVEIVSGDDREVTAIVHGSSAYDVELNVTDDGNVEASCTCPFFEDRLQICKHVWAALTVALDRGHLDAVALAEQPQVTPFFELPVFQDDLPPHVPRREVAPAPPRPAPPKKEPWEVTLDRARTLFQQEA